MRRPASLALAVSLPLCAWCAPLSPRNPTADLQGLPSTEHRWTAPFDVSPRQAQGVLYYEPSPSSSQAPSELPASSASPSSSSPAVPSPSSSPSTPNTKASIVPPSSNTPLVLAYYPGWAVWQLPPEKIDFTKFDIIDFAFGLPNEKFAIAWDDPNSSPSTLRRLVDVANKANKKVVLSIGGWTGSKYFSPAVATDVSRRTFVKNILQVFMDFKLSGIDIDWEYPGHQGEGSNLVSPSDTQNFLAFLQLLRSSLPKGALLTAAVATTPFVDAQQRPMNNVAPFARVLDFITLMNYDTFSASSNPGPNAPLSDACKNSTQPEANAVAAYKAWTSAGFPASKLLLGIASYGYRSTSSATRLRTRRQRASPQSSTLQARDDGPQVLFKTLVKQGKLVKSTANESSGTSDITAFNAGQEYKYGWDSCSSTPFIYSTAKKEVVTFDDPLSLKMKAEWVREVGMGGVNMWELDGDTEQWDLAVAVGKAFGRF